MLKNIYLSKEAQIMNLQFLATSYIESNDEIYFEYHDIEETVLNTCMDHFMTGIRSEMAKTTRLLNIEKKKSLEFHKEIEQKKKDIEDLKKQPSTTPILKTPDQSTYITFMSVSEKSDKKKVYTKVIRIDF